MFSTEFGKSCCFTGHRASKLPWGYNENDSRCIEFKEKLDAVIGAVYESGVTHFICGMANGCDMYCAEAVLKLKETNPDITLEAAVPYEGQAEKWSADLKRRYHDIIINCDKVYIISDKYTQFCMMQRNKYMVNNSAVLIACYNGQPGGTWNTIKFAMDMDREIIQIPID